ncbi:MAG TPA: hypothetical protein VHH73_19855, partial [Verrucomicrobiae bacterium]|nr:hypothetical protein [Verrucomicrobiae bacterium]
MFIWLLTGTVDTLSQTAVILLGISAGTALGGVAVDWNKKGPAASQAPAVGNQAPGAAAPGLENPPAPVPGNPPPAAPAPATQASEGLLLDLISDANGPSVHRFQLVIWNMVLGLIFLMKSFSNLSMPEFNTTLLTLMGISSGTY